MTERAYVSVGSNVEPERHVRAAVRELRAAFGHLVLSSVYQSEPEGFAGDDFYNLVVGFDTDMDPETVDRVLHDIEARNGRQRTGERFSARTLDLDLLLYGDAVGRHGRLFLPRDEILRYAFVLLPLAEIAGDRCHPVAGKTYGELWEAFDRSRVRIRAIPFPFESDR